MEAFAIIGLVGNIVQFVDFSGKLISKSTELYRSSEGALAENIDIETATNHLVLLNSKLKNAATTTGDSALENLCKSCNTAAEKLLAALDRVKVNGELQKWKSMRKALRSVWSKGEIRELERRLSKFREELNSHIVVDLREQVSQLKSEQSIRFTGLDLTTRKIIDAIIQRQDVFEAAHNTQIALMDTVHQDTVSVIQSEHAISRRKIIEETVSSIRDEHTITRRDIIRELRQPKQNKNFAEQQQSLAKLPHAAQAAFNSTDNQHDPLCLKDTRVDVLNQIRAWADGSDERCIFWLNGMAGTGKSTIARTIARDYYNQKRLGASFFFSRGTDDRSYARKFFTTIAMQLAQISPALKELISTAVAERNDIVDQSLRDQWKCLILQPLSMWTVPSSHPPLILAIDALDECNGDKDVQVILELVGEAKSLKSVQLRIFVTSRPETPIRLGFRNMPGILHRDLALHQISSTIVDNDISIFFRHKLKEIRNASDDLPTDWPGKETISILVLKAHGLFIYAATVCRFIEQGGEQWPPDDLLRLLLPNESTDNSTQRDGDDMIITDESPTKDLDKMYSQILEHSYKGIKSLKDRQQVASLFRQAVGTIVVLFNPLSAISIARLLDVDGKRIQMRLRHLHSVLEVPDSQSQPLRLLHPSFRDFLLDKERCSDQFWVDEKKTHEALAGACIRLMSDKLRRDIYGLHSPGALVEEAESDRIGQCLPPELQYACRYWVRHLQGSQVLILDNGPVHTFLRKHLLNWLEALSLMRKTSEGVLAVISLESLVEADQSPSLNALIHDVKRFVLNNRSIIEKAPLQIYCSALVFAPEMSLVRELFERQMPNWLTRLPKVQKEWSLVLQTLEGHSEPVSAVAFSPDGKLLASGSSDKTVRLWDPATEASLQTLKGHSNWVHAVVFSPDGKLLASGSEDKTVRLWDPATGASLQTLEGHSQGVKAVAFSPDGKLLASGSHDKTVRLWDPTTGASLQTLEGHSGVVTAVAFSLNGKLLASGSSDKTVRLWDPATGSSLQTLEGHSDWVYAVVFSPDGKLLASGLDDKTVRLWDPATGASLQTLKGHSHWVHAVAFSPDGKLLASGSYDRTVRLWDPATGASLGKLETDVDVRELSFSGDSQYLYTDRGRLSIGPLGPSVTSPQPKGREREGGLFVNEAWVVQGIKQVLWLPSDYRATCAAVRNDVLALGHASGRVSVLGFNAAEDLI